MDGRCISINVNHYEQVFANKSYFKKFYQMDSKRKARDALNCSIKSLVYLRR